MHCTKTHYAVVPACCTLESGVYVARTVDRVPAFKARNVQFTPWEYELGLGPCTDVRCACFSIRRLRWSKVKMAAKLKRRLPGFGRCESTESQGSVNTYWKRELLLRSDGELLTAKCGGWCYCNIVFERQELSRKRRMAALGCTGDSTDKCTVLFCEDS